MQNKHKVSADDNFLNNALKDGIKAKDLMIIPGTGQHYTGHFVVLGKTKIQTKDIPDQPILEFIYKNGEDKIYTWFIGFDNSLANAMPEGTPKKLVLSKLRSMVKRGILRGCCCGCRGDFQLKRF